MFSVWKTTQLNFAILAFWVGVSFLFFRRPTLFWPLRGLQLHVCALHGRSLKHRGGTFCGAWWFPKKWGPKIVNFVKIAKIVKIVKVAKITNIVIIVIIVKIVKLSKLSKIVKIVKKLSTIVKMLVRSCVLITVIKCLKGHRSLGSLFNVKKQKVAQSVSEWVSEWQGHLLSCQVTAKKAVFRLAHCNILQGIIILTMVIW